MNAGSPAYHAQGNYNSAQRTYRPRGVNAIPLGICRKTNPFCTPPGNSTLDSSLGTPNNYSLPNSPQIGGVSSHGYPQVSGAGSQYGQVAPTKVQDSEARLTKVQEEARVDSNFTIISQWWKTHGKH